MINSGTKKLQIRSPYIVVGMRSDAIMIKKVIDFFGWGFSFRIAESLRVYVNSAEWRKLEASRRAALDGVRRCSDGTLPRSKGTAPCIEWSYSARSAASRCLPCLASVHFTRHFSALPSEAALSDPNCSHRAKRTICLPGSVPVVKPGSYSVKTVLFTLRVGWRSAARFKTFARINWNHEAAPAQRCACATPLGAT